MSIKLNVWLDDLRPMPEGFDTHCKTASEAINLLRANMVAKISLDHDLGEPESVVGTGYQVAAEIEALAHHGMIDPIEITIHSANPVGRRNMGMAIAYAQKFWNEG